MGFLISLGLTSRAAEDPTRFLFATNWFATFTHTLNENGSLNYIEPGGTRDNCAATWHFTHEITVSCQLTPDPLTISHPYFRNFIWKRNDSASVHIIDTFERTCASSGGSSHYHSHTVRDVGLAPTNFSLFINTSDQTYSVVWEGVVVPDMSEIRYDDFSSPGSSHMGWAPEALSSNSLPSTGMVLEGQDLFPMQEWYHRITEASFDFTAGDPRLGGTHPLNPALLTGNLVLSWSLTPLVEELELVIEPADYKTWLPKGDLNNWRNPGDVLFVVAALQTKEGNVPISRATRMRFELLEVSREKGVCMNRPTKGFANEDRDLRFPADLNFPPVVDYWLITSDDGQKAETWLPGEYYIVEAAIASYDFGAYGKLKVTAEVNGQEIVGYLNTDGTKTPKPILLPRRQPDSHVADQWKEENHVTGKADSADDEEIPAGDGHKGDGLTLYEEYRGFSEGGKHFRANPKKKDFFVSDGVRSRDTFLGIMRFWFATGLEVHWKMLPNEFDVDLSLAGPVKTTVNFNHGAEHVVDQHGIIIAHRDVSDDGVSFADALNQGGTPAQYQRVWISPAADGWREITRSDGSKSIHHQGAANLAHELAHTCAVWHHGDSDLTVVWTNQEVVVNGQTNEVIYESGVPIELRLEGDFGYVANPIPAGTDSMNVWIGLPQGQHSGNQDCLMRYDNAYAYPRGTIRYVVDGTEPIGFELCNSPKGTGVNDAFRQFGSRYGDAALLRGNCQSQICVNDLYNGTASHHR